MSVIKDLNMQLLQVCSADAIDYELAEKLLQQGAEPLGAVESDGEQLNLYDEVAERLFLNDKTPEDLYKITELFLRYGMDLEKPTIPYDNENVISAVDLFSFPANECVLRTLKLLLDNGLNAELAELCWGHAIFDLCNFYGGLKDPFDYECYYEYIRKLMLIASYPHVLAADQALQKEIWLPYNRYDLLKFRQWNDFEFEIDTSHCEKGPEIYRSVVYIIEKSSGKCVWTFGVCLEPEDVLRQPE